MALPPARRLRDARLGRGRLEQKRPTPLPEKQPLGPREPESQRPLLRETES